MRNANSLHAEQLDLERQRGVRWDVRRLAGLSTRQAIDLIQSLKGNVEGADIVEFNPRMDPLHITGTVCAKLLKEIAARMLET